MIEDLDFLSPVRNPPSTMFWRVKDLPVSFVLILSASGVHGGVSCVRPTLVV